MDFGQLGFDASFSSTSASNNGGFGFLKQERDSKMSKLSSSNSETMLRFPLQRCNGGSEMLSFSSPNSQAVTLPFYHHTSAAFGRSSGGPFTASQWMELEHQALIYKYITANVPIPCYLLNPIRKAFESAGFRSNAFGWGGFHLGFSNTDPEPGRCRRTDGKKWRCSRDAVADQKYCERHMNRGRHRSRKPVEAQSSAAAVGKTVPASNFHPGIPTTTRSSVVDSQKQQNPAFQEASFGSVCSDSLLNPLNSTSSYRQFMDDWPKTQLSISIPMVASDFMSSTSSPTNQKLTSSPPRFSQDLEMGLGVGDRTQREASWVPISWEPSMGGPLGEVLHTGECRTSTKPLNLIDSWDNSPRLASSPTGVLQRGAFGTSLSNSSAASSPRADPGLMNPSLPAL